MRDTTPCGVCEIAREHRAFHLKEPQYVSREEHAVFGWIGERLAPEGGEAT